MLKIVRLVSEEERCMLTLKGVSEDDFLMAQEIFRNQVEVNFSVESGFGIDSRFEPFSVFDYPKNKEITLLYEYPDKYGVTWLRGKNE